MSGTRLKLNGQVASCPAHRMVELLPNVNIFQEQSVSPIDDRKDYPVTSKSNHEGTSSVVEYERVVVSRSDTLIIYKMLKWRWKWTIWEWSCS